jgi:hypothetical protein
MDKLRTFIARQPSYRLLMAGVLLFLITFLTPKYVGIIPGIIGMATWIVLLGRAVGKSIDEKWPGRKRPWWTNL